MKVWTRALLVSLGCGLMASASRGLEEDLAEPSAVVSEFSGTAWATSADGARTAVARFEWLWDGTRVDIELDSSLTMAFADGRRVRLQQETSVTVTKKGPEVIEGTMTELDPVPPMPQLGTIEVEDPPGERAAAIRIRGRRVEALYPRSPARAVADHAVLWFAEVEEARGYRIEIQLEDGELVLETETTSNRLDVPEKVLEPGKSYRWRVTSVPTAGPPSYGQASFATLSAADAERRTKLASVLSQKMDAGSLALLAAIDRRLGLLAEARQELEAALGKAPDDDDIRRALEELDRRLAN